MVQELSGGDAALWTVLDGRAKLAKADAKYSGTGGTTGHSCADCKFFIELDTKCFITEGNIVSQGVCSHFTSWEKQREPFPGDVAWEYVKKTSQKLNWKEGYVILKGDEGYQCQDCKFYLHWGACMLIKGKFKPEMSCRYILKPGEGIRLEEKM